MSIAIRSDSVGTSGAIQINGVDAVTIGSSGISAGYAAASVTPSALSQPLTQATSQATTSGTSKIFNGIPSWAKRITIALSGVSTSGTSHKLIRIGSGSLVTTGYSSNCAVYATGTVMANSTAGFILYTSAATDAFTAVCHLVNMGGNLWVFSHAGHIGTSFTANGGGSLQLSGALDQLALTTVNGTDTFDAGTINILYE